MPVIYSESIPIVKAGIRCRKTCVFVYFNPNLCEKYFHWYVIRITYTKWNFKGRWSKIVRILYINGYFISFLQRCIAFLFFEIYTASTEAIQMRFPLIISNNYFRSIRRHFHAHTTRVCILVVFVAVHETVSFITTRCSLCCQFHATISFSCILFIFPFGVVATLGGPRRADTILQPS